MNSFYYHNPTKIIFGEGSLLKVGSYIPKNAKVFMVYGGGSIVRTGTYDKVKDFVGDRIVGEYAGVVSNPTVEQSREIASDFYVSAADFLLAVGGGSVIDATKYANCIMKHKYSVGVVLTIPGSGSEASMNCVISDKNKKATLRDPEFFPTFSIIDPQLMASLSKKQLGGGIIDAMSHVLEQYLTYPDDAMVQDRYAEGLLVALIELGERLIEKGSLSVKELGNLAWASTNALNGLLGCGVPQDWSAHAIGHELTAECGLSHPESLAIALLGVIEHKIKSKREKIDQFITRTGKFGGFLQSLEEFFRKLGYTTRLFPYNISQSNIDNIVSRISLYAGRLGERKDIGSDDVREILSYRI